MLKSIIGTQHIKMRREIDGYGVRMKKFGQEDWSKQYKSFISIIVKDSPYPLDEGSFDDDVEALFLRVYTDVISQHSKIKNSYYSNEGRGFLNLSFLDHFLILCYRFSHAIYLAGGKEELADAVYYSCRMRTSTDIFYRSAIGDFFLPSHPLGTVIDSKATYGIGLRLYNGVHIGPYGIDGKPPSEWVHPVIGNGVIIYAKSSIYGKTIIGDNVTISPGTTIVNENIPSNCIVFGASPDLKAVRNKHNNLGVIDL